VPQGSRRVNSIPVKGVSVGNSTTATSINIMLGLSRDRCGYQGDSDTQTTKGIT